MPLRRAVAGVTGEMPFRNGRESQVLLPLWWVDGRGMPLRRAVARVPRKMPLRNGRESRVLLPLWYRG